MYRGRRPTNRGPQYITLQGRSTLCYPDGSTYEGEFFNNQRDGWGVLDSSEGSYSGLWRGGAWAKGTWETHDELVDAEWKESDRDGANYKHGWGVQMAKVRSGANDDYVTLETVYEGEWKWDKRHGGEGGCYVGEWQNDMFHGKGVRVWSDGTTYEGDWAYGQEHGSGTKTWARDGTSFVGDWEMGAPTYGTKKWPNGDMFMGSFTADGVGQGIVTFTTYRGTLKTSQTGTLQKDGVFIVPGDKPTIVVQWLGGGGDCFSAVGRLQRQENEISRLKNEVNVRMTPVLAIQETDLKISTSLGSGSYGTVFKGTHVPSSREVAVKSLHDVIISDYNVDRFRLEAEIVSGLRHPNIVKCLGTCTTESGKLLIVSELMFCSLRHLLSQKRLKFQEVAAIALGVSKGMDGIHRDLSSNNVLLDSHGTPKICDFGVSRGMNSQAAVQQQHTQTKGPGTPLYMSPQMFTDEYTSKGDVWSFGILTTEMIHGVIVDSVFHALPLAAQKTFLDEQKRLLPPPDVEGHSSHNSTADRIRPSHRG
ncbi:Ubiquitin carboxyl-terminal hydrolase CYLD [Pelomyxa schiedti]|nr:Ubiquitin carboxyl-terminal hydrolase CYLD [Pelomyxa schiedti]